jgi:hypothetical protein
MWVLVMTSPSCRSRSLSLSRAAGIAVIWKNRGLSRELTRINTNQKPFAADFRGWALIKAKAFLHRGHRAGQDRRIVEIAVIGLMSTV